MLESRRLLSTYVVSQTADITPATPTLTVSDAGGVAGSAPSFPATASITGANGSPGPSLEGVVIVLTYYAGNSSTGTPSPDPPSQPGVYTVMASFAGSAHYAPTTAQAQFAIIPATSTPTPTPTPTSTPPTIRSEQILVNGKKKHKKPVGIELVFNGAPDASWASNSVNYTLTQSVKHGRKTISKPVPIRVQYTPGSTEVSLMFAGRAAFAKGGQLAVAESGGGIAVFTILKKGRGISG